MRKVWCAIIALLLLLIPATVAADIKFQLDARSTAHSFCLLDIYQTNRFTDMGGVEKWNPLIKGFVADKNHAAITATMALSYWGCDRLIQSIPDKKTKEAMYWIWAGAELVAVLNNRKEFGPSMLFPIPIVKITW